MPRLVSMLFPLILFLTAVPLLPSPASGTTYYMSPAGSTNGATCGSSSDPCQKFRDAIPKLNPGDTLILMDGTYQKDPTGTPAIICSGTASNAKNGAVSARITIKAQNERQALIKAVDWSAHPFWVRHCGYWNIEGLHVEGGDFRSGLANGHAVAIWGSDHIVFRRNLVRFNNRCRNGAIVSVAGTRRSLFEENEIYSFHRNGMGSGSGNVYRRNYTNSRGATNPPCYQTPGSHLTARGDGAYIQYPAADNIVENNISEGNETGFDNQCNGAHHNVRHYGNISYGDYYGGLAITRGGAQKMCRDVRFEHSVAIGYKHWGWSARSPANIQMQNLTAIAMNVGSGVGSTGVLMDFAKDWVGDQHYSGTFTNILTVGHMGLGFYIEDPVHNGLTGNTLHWSAAYINAFGNSTNFSPSSHTSHGTLTHATSINPNLGTCRVFIPEGSPMKGAGKNGADIGANVLYVYENGSLTNKPLWKPTAPNKGMFPCGAIVPGVNDLVGQSCMDVHTRLNVHASGCSLPAGYAGPWPPAPGPLADGGG